MTLSNNDRIKAINTKMSTPFALCEFAGKMEAEEIIWQTLKACEVNLIQHGEAFSFKGTGLRAITGGGLANNPAGMVVIEHRGWLREESRAGIDPPDDTEVDSKGAPVVLVPTEKLLSSLEFFLQR